MWMSEAPRFSASMRRTLESLMTGAASDDFERVPMSISSSSVLTVSTSASASAMESRSTSESPTEAMSSKVRAGPSITSLREGLPPSPMLPDCEPPPPPPESDLSCKDLVEP